MINAQRIAKKGHRGKPPTQVYKSTTYRTGINHGQIGTHDGLYAGGVAMSQAFSPTNVPHQGNFFSPLFSPKENQMNEKSPQPVIAEDIYGEPHYSQVRDGMIRRKASSPSRYLVSLACGPLQKARYINPKIEEELKEFK